MLSIKSWALNTSIDAHEGRYHTCDSDNSGLSFELWWSVIERNLFSIIEIIESITSLLLNIRSMNPIQNYLHIIESYPYILKIFVVILLLHMSF